MPTQTVWIDPELLIEHHGVQVFHTYKHDDYDQGARRYAFTLDAQCGEGGSRCESSLADTSLMRELRTCGHRDNRRFCTGSDDTPENHAAWDRYRE